MGGHAYWYVVPHEGDVKAALDKLRAREFKAGRYNPAMPFPPFPVTDEAPAPGAKHRTIEQALHAAAEDGTRSILDISSISTEPELRAACPPGPDTLQRLYGTVRPTREPVESELDFLTDIERGQAIYIELFDEHGVPHEILFAGYSFD